MFGCPAEWSGVADSCWRRIRESGTGRLPGRYSSASYRLFRSGSAAVITLRICIALCATVLAYQTPLSKRRTFCSAPPYTCSASTCDHTTNRQQQYSFRCYNILPGASILLDFVSDHSFETIWSWFDRRVRRSLACHPPRAYSD